MADRADDDLMSVIARVADGEATRQEAVDSLKKRQVEALDLLVEYLARTGQNQRRRQVASRIDVTRAQQPARGKRKGPPHQTPRLPFQLNGTLYDPQDISRFDETDLDFVAAGDRMLAFDDRSLLNAWLQNSQLNAQMAGDAPSNEIFQKAEHTEVVVTTTPINTGETGGAGVPGGGNPGREHLGTVSQPLLGPVGSGWVWDYIPHTNFYEHVGHDGDRLEMRADTQYADLTQVGMSGIFSGDWNDQISSVQFVAMNYARLGEHVGFAGSNLYLNFQQDTRDLNLFGWNDRASAVETWGRQPVAGHYKIFIGEGAPGVFVP